MLWFSYGRSICDEKIYICKNTNEKDTYQKISVENRGGAKVEQQRSNKKAGK